MGTAIGPARRGHGSRNAIAVAFSSVLLSVSILIGGMAAIEFKSETGCSIEIQAKVWQGTIAAQAGCHPETQPSPRNVQRTNHRPTSAPHSGPSRRMSHSQPNGDKSRRETAPRNRTFCRPTSVPFQTRQHHMISTRRLDDRPRPEWLCIVASEGTSASAADRARTVMGIGP
jgi:hypothetical protein